MEVGEGYVAVGDGSGDVDLLVGFHCSQVKFARVVQSATVEQDFVAVEAVVGLEHAFVD